MNLNNQLNQQGVLFFYDEVLHYRWTCEQTAFYTQSKISAWIYYILMEFNKKKGGGNDWYWYTLQMNYLTEFNVPLTTLSTHNRTFRATININVLVAMHVMFDSKECGYSNCPLHFHLPCECCQYKEPDDDKTTPTLWMLSGQTEWWQMFFFCSQPSHLHGVASFSLHSCYSNIGSNRSRVQSEGRWT